MIPGDRRSNEVILPDMVEDLYEKYSEAEISKMVDAYVVATDGIYGDGEDAERLYLEEILADQYSGMNRGGKNAARAREAVAGTAQRFAGDIENARQNRAGIDNRNGPGQRFSAAEYDNHTPEERAIMREFSNAVDDEFVKFINRTRNLQSQSYKAKQIYTLSEMSDRQVSDIQRLLGQDVKGYENAINGTTITHIDNRHGVDGKADQSMANTEDIARINYVLNNYDDIRLLTDEKGNPVLSTEWTNGDGSRAKQLQYAKKVDGIYYVIEAAIDSSKKRHMVTSAYMNENGSAAQSLNMEQSSPQLTSETPNGSFTSNNTISQRNEKNNPVKAENNSAPATDSAGHGLSEGQQEFFKASAIRDSNGNLLKLYHGTNAEFTVFDPQQFGGKAGAGEGYGIYLTDNKEIATPYGNRLIEGYANIKRPAYGFKKTITKAELKKLIKQTCEAEANEALADEEYDNLEDALRDTFVSGYVYTPAAESMEKVYSDVAKQIYESQSNDVDMIYEIMQADGRMSYRAAYKFFNNILTPTIGIDGFWHHWGDNTSVILAINSNQVKNADNLNPTDNPDIRFSAAEDEEDDGLTFTGNLRRTYEEDGGRPMTAPTDAEEGGQVARATETGETDSSTSPRSAQNDSGEDFEMLAREKKLALAEKVGIDGLKSRIKTAEDRLRMWKAMEKTGLMAKDAKSVQELKSRIADAQETLDIFRDALKAKQEARKAEQADKAAKDERQKKRAEEKKALRKEAELADNKPRQARKEFREEALNLFSVPAAKRQALGNILNSFADKMLAKGSVDTEDRAELFLQLYEAGVEGGWQPYFFARFSE